MAKYTCPGSLSVTTNRVCGVCFRSKTEGRHISPYSVNNIFITKKSKMSQPWKQRLGGHLFFPFGPKNTNLVENVEFLLPVKFRQILSSGIREEVENVKS